MSQRPNRSSEDNLEHQRDQEDLEHQRDQEDLKSLAERIIELSARMQVATYYLLDMIREFDERCGWNTGFTSCAHWLNWRTGLGMGTAREKVRVARALGELPLISEAMSRGELSYSKVRALTRIATPETEEQLLEWGKVGSAAHVERLVRSWRRVKRIEEAERDKVRRESRSLTTFTDEDGMLVVRARLDPETGSVFMRALDAAAEQLYENRPGDEKTADAPEPQQNRADALGLVAESALAGGLDPGTRGDRYLVTVHVDAAVLQEMEPDETRTGMSMLEDGVDVSSETARRLACDSSVVEVAHDSEGNILDVGRKRRTVSPALRRALTSRDRTCRFPACSNRICDAHHVRHWADGGETKLDNLVLLCRRHHAAVHEEGFRLELEPDGSVRFFHPQGWEIEEAPPPPASIGEFDPTLADFIDEAGVEVGPATGSATCYDEPVDYDMAVQCLLRLTDTGADAPETFPPERESTSDERGAGDEPSPADDTFPLERESSGDEWVPCDGTFPLDCEDACDEVEEDEATRIDRLAWIEKLIRDAEHRDPPYHAFMLELYGAQIESARAAGLLPPMGESRQAAPCVGDETFPLEREGSHDERGACDEGSAADETFPLERVDDSADGSCGTGSQSRPPELGSVA